MRNMEIPKANQYYSCMVVPVQALARRYIVFIFSNDTQSPLFDLGSSIL